LGTLVFKASISANSAHFRSGVTSFRKRTATICRIMISPIPVFTPLEEERPEKL
jgi:hypothetical protein